MRKLLSLLFWVAVAVGVWYAWRWWQNRGEVRATIVFRDAGGVKADDVVKKDGVVVGRVTGIDRVDERTAVTVRLEREHRRAILSDSLFVTEPGALVIKNTFSFGSPVENGAIIEAREGKVSRWLAKHADDVQPYVDKLKAKANEMSSKQFDEWTAKVPEWKAQGNEELEKRLAEAKQQVEKLELELRKSDQADEARKLKENFDRWLQNVRR